MKRAINTTLRMPKEELQSVLLYITDDPRTTRRWKSA